MKLILFICSVVVFGWLGNAPAVSINNVPQQPAVTDTIDFERQIQPILVKNCSPCHFSGGKMYERMPFDKDTTIINHRASILKRIKGDDNTLIRSFVDQKIIDQLKGKMENKTALSQ